MLLGFLWKVDAFPVPIFLLRRHCVDSNKIPSCCVSQVSWRQFVVLVLFFNDLFSLSVTLRSHSWPVLKLTSSMDWVLLFKSSVEWVLSLTSSVDWVLSLTSSVGWVLSLTSSMDWAGHHVFTFFWDSHHVFTFFWAGTGARSCLLNDIIPIGVQCPYGLRMMSLYTHLFVFFRIL